MTAAEFLDELDAARAAALTIRQSYPSLPQIVQNETEVEADWSDGGRSVLAECYGEDIAALIVAAVNALPKLTAAVRAVEALAVALDTAWMECRSDEGHLIADRIRAVLADALAGDS